MERTVHSCGPFSTANTANVLLNVCSVCSTELLFAANIRWTEANDKLEGLQNRGRYATCPWAGSVWAVCPRLLTTPQLSAATSSAWYPSRKTCLLQAFWLFFIPSDWTQHDCTSPAASIRKWQKAAAVQVSQVFRLCDIPN